MHRYAVALIVAVVCIGFLCVLPRGVKQAVAATSRFEQKRDAILAACEADRKRLHLTGEQAIKKYPTPEARFPRILTVAPADSNALEQAFEWKGSFLPGTKFLFEGSEVEVIKENLTTTGYTATLRISPVFLPGEITLSVFSPVSCAGVYGTAVRLGGRYEWTMDIANRFQLRVKPLDKSWKGDTNDESLGVPYKFEFYRPGATKFFQVLDTTMFLNRSKGAFWGNLNFGGGNPDDTAEQIKSIQEDLKDTSLDAEAKADLQSKLAELKKQQEAESAYGRLEVDCGHYTLSRNAGGTYSIEVTCGDPQHPELGRNETIKATGSRKVIGT